MSARKVREELAKRWADEPTIELCLAIIDFMERTPPNQLQMLTFRSLQHIANKTEVDSELLKAITVLSSSRVAALDIHAMLVDDDETEHEIAIEALNEARSTGTLIHPQTGYAVDDFETRVFPFYVPSANFLSAES